jgi:hypothetical protein
MKDKKYIESKLKHLKRCGITADIDPETGGVRPEWIKHEQEERRKLLSKRVMKDLHQKIR